MGTKRDFDLVVLGAGSGGVRAARLAARAGRKVAVVEQGRIGGTCVLRGCVPKKLLMIASHFADDLADMAGFGWSVEHAWFDWSRLIAAKNDELARLEALYANTLREAGVTLVAGRGRLLDPHRVAAGDRVLRAENILIATGGRPVLPAGVPGIEHAITSDQALDLMQLPDRLAIVGGGYIAVEFAGIFNALGVAVTQIMRADTVLRGFDADIRQGLAAEMARKGVDLRPGCQVTAIERIATGYALRLSDDTVLETDLVFYATGRRPNSDGLGLEAAGVAVAEGGAIVVDDQLRTSVPHIFAVGDVTDRLTLTPVALAEAAVVVQTLYGAGAAPVEYGTVPSAIFSQPPIATVGMTEAAARRALGAVDVYLSRFRPMRNILAGNQERTLVKMVVDPATDRVLGLHMLGADAPEIVQGFAVALKCGATKAMIDATIGIHPTAAEELVTLRDKRPAGEGA